MLRGFQPIIYGSGEQKRCFSFMTDVVNPIMKSIETDAVDSLVINIGPDDEFISINQLAEILSEIINFKLDPIYMPGRPQEVFHANCSADLARELLDYEPETNLESGLRQLVNWISARGPKDFEYHLPLEIITQSTPRTWTEKLI
jgi:UDP-glucose 4-epimerase